MLALLKLIRPWQWVKNVFVLLPMFFAGKLLEPLCWREALIMFAAFSMAASAVYCFNDAKDAEADRQHPKKRFRPVAAGKVSRTCAFMLATLFSVLALCLCYFANADEWLTLAGILLLYLLLNLAYCLKLKQIGILDVMIVSFGFVLRLASGGIACDIWLSPWIVSLTFLLALFLAFAKRRDDVVIQRDKGIEMRKSVRQYNLDFLNQTLGIIAAVTIVCYIMYTVSPEVTKRLGSDYVYITAIFVLGGILRYLQISIVKENSGSPTKVVLHDRFIQLMVVLWALVFAAIIYF